MLANIRIVDYGPFQQSRCFFETFDENNDIDPVSQKAGVRCHSWITALFLKIFGKIEEIKTSDGKIIYLNRASFEKWRMRHYANLPHEMQTSYLPTAAYIIECRKKLMSQKNEAAAVEALDKATCDTFTKMEQESEGATPPEEGVEIPEETITDYETLICGPEMEIQSPKHEVGGEADVIPATDPEGTTEPDNISADEAEIDFFYPEKKALEQDAQEEMDERSFATGEKAVKLAKRWGLKVAPALFPELKAPLTIMKSADTVLDAVDSYQSGDKLGAIKKVAPLAIGGALLMYGGPFVAAGLAAYKAYSLASLLYDTADLFAGDEEVAEGNELAAHSDKDTADEMEEEHLLWV